MNETQFDAVIIGAGISGLSAAYFLKQKGLSCLVIEKSDLPGGVIRSENKNRFLFEYGPNSTLSGKESVFRLINDGGSRLDEFWTLCAVPPRSSQACYLARPAQIQTEAWHFGGDSSKRAG